MLWISSVYWSHFAHCLLSDELMAEVFCNCQCFDSIWAFNYMPSLPCIVNFFLACRTSAKGSAGQHKAMYTPKLSICSFTGQRGTEALVQTQKDNSIYLYFKVNFNWQKRTDWQHWRLKSIIYLQNRNSMGNGSASFPHVASMCLSPNLEESSLGVAHWILSLSSEAAI